MEGQKRCDAAQQGINELAEIVDSLIVIPNDRILEVLGGSATLLEAFAEANEVLLNAVQGISELITRPGLINVDFADVRTVMAEMGVAMMGSAIATGEARAVDAVQSAVSSPLLEDVNIDVARGLLVNVSAGPDMALEEFAQIGETVNQFAAADATVVIGTVLDPTLEGAVRVTLVATGIRRGGPVEVIEGGRKEPLVKPVDYDTPTVIRRGPRAVATEGMVNVAEDGEYLDIPAFLRRQAD